MPYLKYTEKDMSRMIAVVKYHAELPRVSGESNRAVITLKDLFKNELPRLRGMDLDVVRGLGRPGVPSLELVSKRVFGEDGGARIATQADEFIVKLVEKYGKEGELWQSC